MSSTAQGFCGCKCDTYMGMFAPFLTNITEMSSFFSHDFTVSLGSLLYDYNCLVSFQSIYTRSYQYRTVSNTDYFHTCTFFPRSVSSFPECWLLFLLFSLFLPHRRASSRFYDIWKILDYNSTSELMKRVSFPPFPFCLQTFCLVYILLYTDHDIQLRPKTHLKWATFDW